jgi:hypothetical protein
VKELPRVSLHLYLSRMEQRQQPPNGAVGVVVEWQQVAALAQSFVESLQSLGHLPLCKLRLSRVAGLMIGPPFSSQCCVSPRAFILN